MLRPEDLRIPVLGSCGIESPLGLSTERGDMISDFVPDDARVLCDAELRAGGLVDPQLAFERAGPRQNVFFEPAKTRAAIVTCGGLCPGLNNVIRSAYFELNANYGVADVLGIRFGYQGLNPEVGQPPIRLKSSDVEEIHTLGGTVLGTSRGEQPIGKMVDFLQQQGINVLLCVGGDGTQCGAHRLAQEVRRRELAISVVGIPKTIDNDIAYVERSFGYQTALEKAQEHITGAHAEAVAVHNGMGLVKLMGRHAGFIAAGASVASGQVNFVLIPEVPFELKGPHGLLIALERRLAARQHAVIVVAEGAGQNMLEDRPLKIDASGNRKPGDIGSYLKQQIGDYFDSRQVPVSIKYFDPSYHIRSVPANSSDSLLCALLARRAVHAAMAGKTDLLIGLVHGKFVHVPLPLVTEGAKRVDPDGELWMSVQTATGQRKWTSPAYAQ